MVATQKGIEETLRRCLEESVLTPFGATRQKELTEIMVTLFDQDKITDIHDYHIAEGARKDGIQQRALQSIQDLIKNIGLSVERTMAVLRVSEAERSKYVEMLMQ